LFKCEACSLSKGQTPKTSEWLRNRGQYHPREWVEQGFKRDLINSSVDADGTDLIPDVAQVCTDPVQCVPCLRSDFDTL